MIHLLLCHSNYFIHNLRIFLFIHWTYRVKNSYQKHLLCFLSLLRWQVLKINVRLCFIGLRLILYSYLVLLLLSYSLGNIFLHLLRMTRNSLMVLIFLIVLERIWWMVSLIFRSSWSLFLSFIDSWRRRELIRSHLYITFHFLA